MAEMDRLTTSEPGVLTIDVTQILVCQSIQSKQLIVDTLSSGRWVDDFANAYHVRKRLIHRFVGSVGHQHDDERSNRRALEVLQNMNLKITHIRLNLVYEIKSGEPAADREDIDG